MFKKIITYYINNNYYHYFGFDSLLSFLNSSGTSVIPCYLSEIANSKWMKSLLKWKKLSFLKKYITKTGNRELDCLMHSRVKCRHHWVFQQRTPKLFKTTSAFNSLQINKVFKGSKCEGLLEGYPSRVSGFSVFSVKLDRLFFHSACLVIVKKLNVVTLWMTCQSW